VARRLVGAIVGVTLLAALLAAVLYIVGAPASMSSARHAEPGVVFQCAMHPQIVRDEPGDCPICGMRLMRRDAAELALADGDAAPAAEPAPQVHAAASPGTSSAPVAALAPAEVAGRAPFVLTRERQQLIGVKRGTVERRALALEIRAPGRIAYDPALYQALGEYREALRAAGGQGAHTGGDAMVRAARLKLRQQGLSEALLRDLVAGADPVELLLPGASAWVYAQIFESDASLVTAGQTVRITTQSYPGRTFTGRVVGVDPIVDATSRTVRARIVVASDGATLRPESLVDARIDVPLGDTLAVPRDAVLNSGEHRIVFVVRGAGSFAPREVQLGRTAGAWVEVRSGLDAGDEVVTSANFLIDSESKIRAALTAFQGAGGEGGGAAPGAAAGAHQH
jgi:Cu(I)/Ag(I) efflux system membrane fusion protein